MTLKYLPIAVPQALWVSYRAAKLPEAAGPRSGREGDGPPLRMMLLGDSSIAGVGVQHQDEALAGQLVRRLCDSREIHWRVVAKSGATTASTLTMLEDEDDHTYDTVVLGLGVNDAKNGVAMSAWERRYRDILDILRERHAAESVLISGLPPVRQFPLLPWPLNDVVGARVEAFDAILRDLAEEYDEASYVSLEIDIEASQMAEDGFHPGPELYAEWADRAARHFPPERS
ncbi:MAG: SGNH/GDSL hydrolase family protein [Paracoccaceae bacterium]|nr:SGNH/GDSL hydrolase family protein [Paracoccaceae bacterium]